jgi:protease-4
MFAYLIYGIRYCFWLIGNLFRRLGKTPDYIVITLSGDYPEIPQPVAHPILQYIRPPGLSLLDLAERFRLIAHDPRIRGVILHLRPLEMPAAKLDTIRDMIAELRAAGKRVIVWSYMYDSATYYVANAADTVLLSPGGVITPLGLQRGYLYFADALARVGIRADIVQISPYKSAGDMFTRSNMSDEAREMADWLINATFDEMVRAIASGREVNEKVARKMIDSTPCTDLQAKDMSFVDALLSEEDLPVYLSEDDKPACLAPWEEFSGSLLRRSPKRPGRYVALLSIEGMIIDGESQRPPIEPPVPLPILYDAMSGDISVVRTARKILSDKRAAAVVLYVDSRGGSATASESMGAALEKIAAKKPLVVAMGPVAASGGYWVSIPGEFILSQPNTITGSIGVLSGKIYNAGLLEKLMVNREMIRRGEGASFFDFGAPFSDEERIRVWEQIERLYGMFLDRVSQSRGMERQDVDAIGGGRVWTGRQAIENGLVDGLGGLEQAIAKARELGGLDERSRVRLFFPGKRPVAPIAEPATALKYALTGVRLFNRGVPMSLCPLVWDEWM